MKTTRTETVALRKLSSDKFREVSREMVAALAAKGLCTPDGNVTDAGFAAAGLDRKRTSFARSAHLYLVSMRYGTGK